MIKKNTTNKTIAGEPPPEGLPCMGVPACNPRPCSAGKGDRAIFENKSRSDAWPTDRSSEGSCERPHEGTGPRRTVSPTWLSRLLRSPHSHRRGAPETSRKKPTTPTASLGTSLSPPLEKTINQTASYDTRTTGKRTGQDSHLLLLTSRWHQLSLPPCPSRQSRL